MLLAHVARGKESHLLTAPEGVGNPREVIFETGHYCYARLPLVEEQFRAVTTQQLSATRRMPFYVRPMRVSDMHDCSRVEREAFPALCAPTSFRRELRNPLANYLIASRDVPGQWIADPNEENVVAQASILKPRLLSRLRVLSPWPHRRIGAMDPKDVPIGFVGVWYLAGEAHIVSVCVGTKYRSQGVGELLLLACIEHATTHEANTVTLEVRTSNYVAQNLYRKYGFTTRGLRKAYYSDDREDAIIMTTEHILSPGFRGRFLELARSHEVVWGKTKRILD